MKNMIHPEDLKQITQESLDQLSKSDVIQLALRLKDLGIALREGLDPSSSNGSRPPSSENPNRKK